MISFQKIFDEWLFAKEKTFNPFLRYLKESVGSPDKVIMPEEELGKELEELVQSPKDY